MKNNNNQFIEQVLASEFEEIKARRASVNSSTGDIENDIQGEVDSLVNEKTTKNKLVGLACSGGGIRSASFCMGVIQQLLKKDVFKKIDYLSTVSGGGYTGSCVSSLMKNDSNHVNFLVKREGNGEPKALNHIRNYSEYLKSEGFLSNLRIPILFTEGVLRSILTFFPLVVLAIFLTEVFFELTGRFSVERHILIPLLGVTPLIFALILRPIRKDKLPWEKRDKADRRLVNYTAFAILSLIAIPALSFLREIVHQDASSLWEAIKNFVTAHETKISLLMAGLGLAVTWGFYKMRRAMFVVLASISAPLFLVILYVVLCIGVINSPYSNRNTLDVLNAIDGSSAHEKTLNDTSSLEKMMYFHNENFSGDVTNSEATCTNSEVKFCKAFKESEQTAINDVLKQKHINPKDYCVTSVKEQTLELCRIGEPQNGLMRFLTTSNSTELNIHLVKEYDTDNVLLMIDELRLLDGDAEWWFYLLGILAFLYNSLFGNINRFSLHPFYRDRLSRTFLIDAEGDDIVNSDKVKMSELNSNGSTAPYHIINTALNLQGSKNAQLRSRKTVPFILSKRYCGSDFTGYCETQEIEEVDKYFDLGTAMAISAAAAAPNMGAVGPKSLSFLFTLLNIRLSYWLPHPGKLKKLKKDRPFIFRPLGLSYLLKEALSKVNEERPYINCSDGGHIENLAVYELLRRQCKTIICIDAEADPTFSFFGFITLQRYAEIDLGVKIDIDLSDIKPSEGLSNTNHAIGDIKYSNGETGKLIYLKLSYTGQEAEYIQHYRSQNAEFPHQATSDQFFDETQFEAYRALGSYVAESTMDDLEQLLKN